MPSHEAPSYARRPTLLSRHSSGSSIALRHTGDPLSTSLQKSRTRHVVGRMGPGSRNPSYNKNVNKLSKLGTINQDGSVSPRQTAQMVKRNSSNTLLSHHTTHTALKKNHSETSLKRNRSGGNLLKLAAPQPAKSLIKTNKNESSKRHSTGTKAENNPTVRFNLGNEGDEESEDDWVEDNSSISPNTTRSNTKHNSETRGVDRGEPRVRENTHNAGNASESPQDSSPDSSVARNSRTHSLNRNTSNHELSSTEPSREARAPEADRLTSRLLNRNVSFSSAPKISTKTVLGHEYHESQTAVHMQDPEDPQLISRFINAETSSVTPRENSSFLPQNGHDSESPRSELPRRNSSTPHMSRAPSRASSHRSNPSTVADGPSSRTQQKLWLDRAFVLSDLQPGRPLGLPRSSRVPNTSLPFQTVNSEGRVHPQLKQMFDQTDIEYRRVCLFQNPLADGISRVRNLSAKSQGKQAPKSVLTISAPNGMNERASSSRGTDGTKNEGEKRKTRVMFQGLKEPNEEDADERMSGIDDKEAQDKKSLTEAQVICRRLWERHTLGADDD